MKTQKKPWVDTQLFQYLKEVDEKGYNQMLEYEKAGGELDATDKMAKKYYEKHYRNKKRTSTPDEDMETKEPIEVW